MLGQTEDEIRAEMASALGRIGRRLESLLEMLNQPATTLDPEKYENLLKEARMYYWYLIVQRESIGLRNHDDVRRIYAIPRAVARVAG